MALSRTTAPQFSIDDAFDDNLDDIIVISSDNRSLEKSWNPRHEGGFEEVRNNTDRDSQPVLLNIRTGLSVDDTTSKGSDSLINENTSSYFSVLDGPWWQHPRVKENWKVVTGSFALLVIGLVLLVIGIVVFIIPSGGVQGLVFLIAGAICFIPGAYHIVYIYLAVKGARGYDFYHLPLFN